jgi:hypothetical protein
LHGASPHQDGLQAWHELIRRIVPGEWRFAPCIVFHCARLPAFLILWREGSSPWHGICIQQLWLRQFGGSEETISLVVLQLEELVTWLGHMRATNSGIKKQGVH